MHKKQNGFTIIEVLIVLVIAAVIMLIVFLAVPAIQRSSRNNARRSDISRALAAFKESGVNRQWDNPLLVIAQGISNMGTLSVYEADIVPDGSFEGGTSASSNIDRIVIAYDYRCEDETTVTSQARSIALLYRIETATGSVPQCDSS